VIYNAVVYQYFTIFQKSIAADGEREIITYLGNNNMPPGV